MSRNRSFERRARVEVERIKALEAEEARRKEERMAELGEEAKLRREARAAEEALRNEERDTKLIRAQDSRAQAEERLAKHQAWLTWKTQGGSREKFSEAWPSMWQDILRARIVRAATEARDAQRLSGISRL